MRPLTIGVLGCGGIAERRTIPGMKKSEHIEISIVQDIDPEKARKTAAIFKIPEWSGDEDAVLARSDVDAVYIASPVFCHAEQIKKAAVSSKHILCEKPLGRNADETKDIISACNKAGVVLQSGFMMRYHGYHKEIKSLIESGALGSPVMGRAQLTCWYPPMDAAWRQDPQKSGGGALMDMGIHCIDLLRFFFGEVREVAAAGGSIVHEYPVEDSSVVLLRFENEAVGVCDSFFNIPDKAAKGFLEVYGSRGSVLAESTISQEAGGKALVYQEGSRSAYDAGQRRNNNEHVRIKTECKDLYQAEAEDFAAAVRTGKEVMNSGAESLKNIQIAEAAYLSMKEGRSIPLQKGERI